MHYLYLEGIFNTAGDENLKLFWRVHINYSIIHIMRINFIENALIYF